MSDIKFYFYIALILLAVTAFFVIIIGIPVYFLRKKEIKAFEKLADRYNFRKTLGKASIFANFPIISGLFEKKHFVIRKVKVGKYHTTNAATGVHSSRQIWHLQISTNLKNSNIQKFDLQMNKVFSKVKSDDFEKYIECKIEPEKCRQAILTEDIKRELLNIRKEFGTYTISKNEDRFFASDYKGLTNDNQVESCSRKLEVMSKIIDACDKNSFIGEHNQLINRIVQSIIQSKTTS